MKWYDLITTGLSIQAVAAIKKWNPIPEKQQQAFEKALNGKKKFKVGGHQRFGESTVRRGFNIIFKAIHRKKAPARERDIQREAGLPESSYQCPKHPDNRCDEKCQYYGKFLKNALRNFDDVYEEFPVGWDIEFKDTHTPYSSE